MAPPPPVVVMQPLRLKYPRFTTAKDPEEWIEQFEAVAQANQEQNWQRIFKAILDHQGRAWFD